MTRRTDTRGSAASITAYRCAALGRNTPTLYLIIDLLVFLRQRCVLVREFVVRTGQFRFHACQLVAQCGDTRRLPYRLRRTRQIASPTMQKTLGNVDLLAHVRERQTFATGQFICLALERVVKCTSFASCHARLLLRKFSS